MAMTDKERAQRYREKQKAALAAIRAADREAEVLKRVLESEQNPLLVQVKKYFLTSEIFAEEVKGLVRKERSKREAASRVR
ncbi:hypothetical protein W02_16770 [Nitrospira sp. KM1]|nr:hypothetical protein W02_16770 [Nitrospira sp. KM1]